MEKRAQRIPSWPGVIHSNKGRIHLRRPTCGVLKFRLRRGGGPYIPISRWSYNLCQTVQRSESPKACSTNEDDDSNMAVCCRWCFCLSFPVASEPSEISQSIRLDWTSVRVFSLAHTELQQKGEPIYSWRAPDLRETAPLIQVRLPSYALSGNLCGLGLIGHKSHARRTLGKSTRTVRSRSFEGCGARCVINAQIGMYGPPPRRKRNLRTPQVGLRKCIRPLLEWITPGQDGMRCALFSIN